MNLPAVSIIIPSRNSEKTIKTLLDSIFSLNYPKDKYEVIVVDSSTDKTRRIVKNYPVNLIKLPATEERNISLTLNTGIKESKHPFLAFVDSDCNIKKNWLRNLILTFLERGKKENLACIGGKVIASGNIFDKYVNSTSKSPMRNVSKEYLTDISNFHKRKWPIGSNFLTKKEIIKEVGYFNEKLEFYEEVDLFWRICRKGYNLLLIPKSTIEHSYQRNLFEMIKTYVRYGKGCGYFCKKYKKSKFAKYRILLLFSILSFYLLSISIFSLAYTSQISKHWILIPFISYFYDVFYYLSKLKRDKKYSILFPFLDFIFCGIGYTFGMLYSILKSPIFE